MKKETVLVTGATGFVGRYVVPTLADAGYPVVVLARQPLRARRHGIKTIQADLSSPRSLARHASLLRRCEIVVHLAANVPRSPQEDAVIEYSFDKGLTQTRNLLDVVKPRLIIFGSTIDVYGSARHLPIREDHLLSPQSYYAAAKVAAEGLLAAWSARHGVALTILRFAHVYGPGDTSQKVIPRAIATILGGDGPVLQGGGKDTRDYVFAGDVAGGVLAAVRRGVPGVFNMGSGRETSVRTAVREVVKASGRAIKPRIVTSDRPVTRLYLDMHRAQSALRFRPRTSLSDGVREAVRLFRPTVVCDLDGTLLDVRRRYYEVYFDLAPTKQLLSAERYWSLKRRGYSDRKIVALTVDDARALAVYDRRRLRVIEKANYLKLDTLVPGAEAVLADLSKRFKLVIITARQEHRRLLEQLDALGISRFFTAILSTGLASGEQITIKKTRLIRSLGVPIVAMIGDAASDLEIARRVGGVSIAATYGIRTRAILAAAKPDHFVNSIRAFPQLVDEIAAPRCALWPLDWAEAGR